MGQIGWDTPPTEEELKQAGQKTPTDWDTPPTPSELKQAGQTIPDYVKETPTPPEQSTVEPLKNSPQNPVAMGLGLEGTVAPEDNQVTKEPLQMYREDKAEFARAEAEDVSQTLADIQQATSTLGDQLGVTDDSEKAMSKFNKEATRVLKEKGYRIENRGNEKVIIGKTGTEYPMTPDFTDQLQASGREIGGSLAAGAGTGALVGTVAGPVGSAIGGAIGGMAGAVLGDRADAKANAKTYGIDLSDEELDDRALEVAVGDLFGSAGGAIVGKIAGKLSGKAVSEVMNYIKAGSKPFTTIDELPSRYRKTLRALQKQSDLSDEEMEQAIKRYAESTQKGELTAEDAIEAGSRVSEKEQEGFAIEAMKQDTEAKANVINEATKRTDDLRSVIAEDEQLSRIMDRFTLDDKGRRKATDWSGFYNALKRLLPDDDPLMQKVKQYADTFGSKETDAFQATVRPITPEEKTIKALQPFSETTRASWQSQFGATGIGWVDKILKFIAPGEELKALNRIKKAMKNPKIAKDLTPEETTAIKQTMADLEEARMGAVKEAEEAMQAKEAKQAEREAARQAKEAERHDKAIMADYNKKIKEIEAKNKKRVKEIQAQEKKKKAEKEAKRKAREAEYAKMADEKAAQDKKVAMAKKKVEDLAEKEKSKYIIRMNKAAEKAKKKKSIEAGLKGKKEEPTLMSPSKLDDVTKGSETINKIRKEHAQDNVPIGENPETFRETGETKIKSNAREKQAKLKEAELGNIGEVIESTLKKPEVTEKDREILEMAASPGVQSTDEQKQQALKKLESLNTRKHIEKARQARENARETVKQGYIKQIKAGKAEGASETEKELGRQAKESLTNMKIIERAEKYPEPTGNKQQDYLASRYKILREEGGDTVKGKKALKEIREREAKQAELERTTRKAEARAIQDKQAKKANATKELEDYRINKAGHGNFYSYLGERSPKKLKKMGEGWENPPKKYKDAVKKTEEGKIAPKNTTTSDVASKARDLGLQVEGKTDREIVGNVRDYENIVDSLGEKKAKLAISKKVRNSKGKLRGIKDILIRDTKNFTDEEVAKIWKANNWVKTVDYMRKRK